FVRASRNTTLAMGEGLPGRVWASGKPAWIPDVARDENFPRASLAAGAGLHGAFCFAVPLSHELFGVIECFSGIVEPKDEALLEMLGALGTQVGQFIERAQAQNQLREASANLERSNTDLQLFANVASHDLSEPLRMVLSYL